MLSALSLASTLFRVIDPAYPRNNIYRFAARRTISLGPVMIASVAHKALPWLEAEVISENNYHWRRRGGPHDAVGMPDHEALQQQRMAHFVGISASISNATPRALEVIRTYKAMPAPLRPKAIVVGGWHAGDCPEEFLEAGADVVVHGEGVAVIVPLLEALAANTPLTSIPGISYHHHGAIRRNSPEFVSVSQPELEALPDANFDLVRYARLKVVPISRTWGCSGRCRFCRVRQAPRARSPQRFVGEIKALVSKGHRQFFVVDDRVEEDLPGFTAWLQQLAAFREGQGGCGLDLTVQARLSLARHPDILQLMRRAGISTVAIGYESPIPEEIWAMRKPVVPGKMADWTRIWKKAGFFVHAMMIFGYPMPPDRQGPCGNKGRPLSVRERGEAFWRFLKQTRPDTLQVLLLTPIPGTEDWQALDQAGRIWKRLSWKLWDGLHLVFRPDEGLNPREVQHEVMRLHQKFYAFSWLGSLGPAALLLHLLRVGVTTVLVPFLWLAGFLTRWPYKGAFTEQCREAWQYPRRLARNARRHFQAYLIFSSVRKELRAYEHWLDKMQVKLS